MSSSEFNRQIHELQLERVRLERRLQHVQDSITALMAMQKSSEATDTPLFDEVYGG